jgi:hypothetical protein
MQVGSAFVIARLGFVIQASPVASQAFIFVEAGFVEIEVSELGHAARSNCAAR